MASSHGRVSKIRLDIGTAAESNGMCAPASGETIYRNRGSGGAEAITRLKLCKKDPIPAVLSNALFCGDLHSFPYVHEADSALAFDQHGGSK